MRKTRQDKELQKNTLRKMIAYQKKAEQMTSKRRQNQHMIRKG